MSETRTIIRYSKAFQQKVVSEIESGKLTIGEAQKIYDIKGCDTIQNWLRKFGKNHLLAKVVRVEMKDVKDKICLNMFLDEDPNNLPNNSLKV